MRFRHEVYAHIAEHEREAWATCGRPGQREKMIKEPSVLERGYHPSPKIVEAWAGALREACDGFEFGPSVRGNSQPGLERGYWTTALVFNPL